MQPVLRLAALRWRCGFLFIARSLLVGLPFLIGSVLEILHFRLDLFPGPRQDFGLEQPGQYPSRMAEGLFVIAGGVGPAAAALQMLPSLNEPDRSCRWALRGHTQRPGSRSAKRRSCWR
jgi:hypothetical protein